MIQRRTAAAFGVLLLEGFRGPGTPVSAHRLDFNDYGTPRCVLRAAVRAGHAHSAGLCTSGPRKGVDGADARKVNLWSHFLGWFHLQQAYGCIRRSRLVF